MDIKDLPKKHHLGKAEESQFLAYISNQFIRAVSAVEESGGSFLEKWRDIHALDGYSGMFYRNTKASGVIPQIAVILGPCAGGACYSPAICDFIFMSQQTGHMFITGPKVVKAVTGEEITADELGGAVMQSETSGVVHYMEVKKWNCQGLNCM